MARKEKIKFPKWTNRPRRFIIFEMDEVYVFVGSIFGLFLLCVLLGIKINHILIIVAVLTYVNTKAYKSYKEGQTKGVLYHWLYTKNILSLKEDPKVYKDCQYMDNLPILPIGYEVSFRD